MEMEFHGLVRIGSCFKSLGLWRGDFECIVQDEDVARRFGGWPTHIPYRSMVLFGQMSREDVESAIVGL